MAHQNMTRLYRFQLSNGQDAVHRKVTLSIKFVGTHFIHLGEERHCDSLLPKGCSRGCRGGESTCLPLLWPGFDSRTRRHMWVEFVVGSCPYSEGFSPGTTVFLPPQKPTLQIPIRSGNEGHRFVSFAVSVILNK